MIKSRKFFCLGALALLTALLMMGNPVQAQQKNIILATTTSTQDSGLLDVLIPMFEKKTGFFVKTIAVGSGQAMAMGQKGEADVLLVHSRRRRKNLWPRDLGSTGALSCTMILSSWAPGRTRQRLKG